MPFCSVSGRVSSMTFFGLMMSLLLCNSPSFGQRPFNREEMVFRAVEQPPEFPGGLAALTTYIQKNVQYPPEARKEGVEGRVFVSFIVEKDGSLTDSQLLKGIGYGCDEEALRVIRAMPKWIPGRQSGRTERVLFKMPVFFGVDYPAVEKR